MAEASTSKKRREHFLVAALVLSPVALSLWLVPDPRGYGTHEQLGLPPCGFRLLTGIPCPGCGGTTAFVLSTQGRFTEAIRAHVAGAVLAPLCCVAGATEVLLGIGVLKRARRYRAVYLATAASALAVQLALWLARFSTAWCHLRSLWG